MGEAERESRCSSSCLKDSKVDSTAVAAVAEPRVWMPRGGTQNVEDSTGV